MKIYIQIIFTVIFLNLITMNIAPSDGADCYKQSLSDAYNKALAIVEAGRNGKVYKLFAISNVGMDNNIINGDCDSDINRFVDKSGKAGQWTFDFYLDNKPEISVKDGKKFYTYENWNIAVTGNFIGGGPYIDALYSTGIMQPREEYVRTYDKAFKLALSAIQKEKFDFIAATCQDFSGKPSWIFSFFTKEIKHVITIQVKADGTKILLKKR